MQDEKRKLSPVAETLICAVLFLVSAWLGKYVYVTYLILPFIGAYVYARNGISWAALLLVTGGVIFYFLIPESFLIALAMTAVPSLITGYAIRKKLPAYESVLLSAGGWLLAAGAAIAYIYYAVGMNPLDWIMTGVQSAIDGDDSFARMLYSSLNITQSYSGGAIGLGVMSAEYVETVLGYFSEPMDTVREYLAESSVINLISNSVGVLVSGALMTTVVAGGLTSYVVPRAIAKKAGTEVQYIPPFKMFRLPPKTSGYVVITYLLSLVPSYFGIESLVLPGILLSSAIGTVFVIQGTTLICWLLSKKLNRGLSVFLSLLISLLGMNLFIGLFDQVLKVRDRAGMQRPGNPRQ